MSPNEFMAPRSAVGRHATMSRAGEEWLRRPLKIEPSPSAIFGMANEIAASFQIQQVEALTALAGALSLLVGPSVYVETSWGSVLPLTLQIAMRSGENANFERAVKFLSQSVIDSYASEYGREMMEDSKTLTVDQIEAERRIQARAEELKAGKKLAAERAPYWNSERNAKDVAKLENAEMTEIREYFRILRKKSMFPYGGVLDGGVVDRLIEDNTDIFFGSFSTDGTALRHLVEAPPQERGKVVRFLNASFQGDLLTHQIPRPVYPTAAAFWICDPQLIEEAFVKRIPAALPGLLLASSTPPVDGRTAPVLSPETRNKWTSFVRGIIQTVRFGFSRRYMEGGLSLSTTLDEQATAAFSESLDWPAKFTIEAGYPRSVLAKAPEQILKIAALLNLDSIPPKPLVAATVILAKEVYRWLAGATIRADAHRHSTAISSDIDRLTQKLQLNGPLTIRDLVRTYSKQDYGQINATVAAAIKAGRVEHNRNCFRAVSQ